MGKRLALAALVIGAAGLAACADKPSITARDSSAPAAMAMTAIAAGIAMPPGYKIDADRTLIFGTDANWTGRLAYTTKSSADEVYDFLHKEMQSFGWSELASMRSDTSILTFVSEATSRVATIHIGRGSMLGSTVVDLVVAPQQAAPKATAAPRQTR